MGTKYEALLTAVYEIHDIDKARAVLMWDQEVNMPRAGREARVQQLTTLSQLSHAKSTSDGYGELIEAAAGELRMRSQITFDKETHPQRLARLPKSKVNNEQALNGADFNSNEASLIRYLRRTYADGRKLPAEFVTRVSRVSGAARPAWIQARAENDFAVFQPHLETVIEMCQEMAEFYGYDDEKYDALLDKYEHGMKTADVRAIFDAVKQELVPLRQAIEDRGTAVSDKIVHQPFDIETQKQFAYYIADAIGYDFERGHLGTVVHPFATSFTRNDARITTRWNADFLNPALFGTLHESGHAMYEQGTHADLARTPLARGTSMGIHESQSRMMENIVGRSRGFWETHYPKLQSYFPDQLNEYTAKDFYRAINKVHPSYIRVEADELTYNFHIILRFELEQAMLNGDLVAADLPTAWNDKMQELLGIVPPTDTVGCLQDVHWSRPGFGYFPTYALGNLYAAQLWETAVSVNPAIQSEMNQGKTDALLGWLRENIHQHGRKFTASTIIQRATGKPLSHEPFMRYVTVKFSQIYAL